MKLNYNKSVIMILKGYLINLIKNNNKKNLNIDETNVFNFSNDLNMVN